NQIGIEELLDFIINFMPSSDELPPLKGKNSNGEEIERERKADGPLSGIVFKTIFDPFIGRVSYLRIFSGKLLSNSVLFNSTKNKKERIGQLLKLIGKKQEPVSEAIAGEFVAIPKISAETFDTFSDPNDVIIYPPPTLPEGALSLSIAPKVKGTEDKLGNAIGRILEEDPTIKIFRDNETGETIISGMGELHLDVTINKFKNKFGVEVKKGIPKIAYKETITKSANAEGKYKRQTGGRGQYGHCFIKVEPLPRGAGFEFVDKIVGGVIPRNFIPSVEKGVRQAMQKGVLANYPIVDIKVTLYDGSYHPVDSSDIAFQIAGSMALQKAVKEAGLILLEPIVNVEIRVPQEFVGDIIGSINAKRGKVLDMIPSGSTHIIKAQVPLAEMANYTTELRSITSGRGSYTMEFSHYQEVPPHIAQKIIEERKKEKEGKE
ncbi:MAG: elongation factor G, partial [Candidatus Omnitrophota bacterium]